MKNTLLLFALSISVISIAQTDEKNFKNEIGFNASGFASNYLNFGGGVISNNPYTFTYKRFFNSGAIRTGLSANGSKFDDNRFVNNGADQTNFVLDSRIGYEWSAKLAEKWSLIYGIDALFGLNNFKRKSFQKLWDGTANVPVTNVSVNNNQTVGIGPIAGIEWAVTKRIALYTEARLYGRYTEIESGTKWDGVTDELRFRFGSSLDDNIRSSFQKDIILFVPLDIFVTIKF